MKTKVCYILTAHREHEDGEETRHHVIGDVEKHDGDASNKGKTHRHKNGADDERVVLKNEDYYKYIAKHGHHFSKSLSECVVENLNSLNAKIPFCKVEEILKQSDDELDDGNTVADLHYIANTIKARHSTSTVKSDAHVVMLAIEYLNDPNKSEGEVFCEWFDGLKRRNSKVSWDKFI